jgi:antitoxin MazE
MYIRESTMQVAKWGNSLAVRLPQAVVEALKLKPGDDIEITVSSGRRFEVARDRTIERALASIRKFRGRMPAGFKFDRGAANERR